MEAKPFALEPRQMLMGVIRPSPQGRPVYISDLVTREELEADAARGGDTAMLELVEERARQSTGPRLVVDNDTGAQD